MSDRENYRIIITRTYYNYDLPVYTEWGMKMSAAWTMRYSHAISNTTNARF